MKSTGTETPDRLITDVDERRPALVDVIRRARRQITLSLFRCNDDQVLEELAAATARGVVVDVLVTSRAKGGKKKIEKLWQPLHKTAPTLRPSTHPALT